MTIWESPMAMFWIFACCAVFVFALIIRKYRKELKATRAKMLDTKRSE